MENIKELKGANIDIDLVSNPDEIDWKQDKCPWNEVENVGEHKCAVKNVSLCKFFKGVKYPDIILCDYDEQ